jgi:hypothetical protein
VPRAGPGHPSARSVAIKDLQALPAVKLLSSVFGFVAVLVPFFLPYASCLGDLILHSPDSAVLLVQSSPLLVVAFVELVRPALAPKHATPLGSAATTVSCLLAVQLFLGLGAVGHIHVSAMDGQNSSFGGFFCENQRNQPNLLQ